MNGRGLKVGGRLDRYVGGLFVSSYATAFLLVVGLFLILDMAANLDDYLEPWPGGERAPNLLIGHYYLLHVPFLFLQVAPFVTLVAGLFTVGKLIKHNETVAALAAGVSSWRMLAPIFACGALCAVGMFALREGLSSALAAERDALRFVLENKQSDVVYPDLMLRDPAGSLVRLAQFRPAPELSTKGGAVVVAPEIRGLEATIRSGSQYSSVAAPRAVYVPRGGKMGWRLEGGTRRDVAGSQRNEQPAEWLDGFDFTPALAIAFWRASTSPLELSFAETRELARRDPDTVVYKTLLQYHLTFPLANLVLLLVGLPVLMRHERRKGAEGIALGSLLCIFYFSTDFVMRNMGLQGSLDPMLAAWLPVLFFGSIGLVLYDGMKS